MQALRRMAVTVDAKQKREDFYKWNATSVILTAECLEQFLVDEPDSQVRRYTEGLLRRFVDWYDGLMFYQRKPQYAIDRPECVTAAREVLAKAK